MPRSGAQAKICTKLVRYWGDANSAGLRRKVFLHELVLTPAATCPFFQELSAGMVSAMIPVSLRTPNGAAHPLFYLGDLNGKDRRRSVENGKRQRSQIR
jgi:hypothetical protein